MKIKNSIYIVGELYCPVCIIRLEKEGENKCSYPLENTMCMPIA